MFPTDDPQFIWVCASGEMTGDGTRKNPFGRIETSLKKAQPGQTIVLLEGTYRGDVTFQASGTMEKPLRITVDKKEQTVIGESCWYFYDVSDMILSGLVFKDSPLGSVAVMGKCERNRFERLLFQNCCSSQKASCSLFFGGSGASCNIVEFCGFERPASPPVAGKSPDDLTVGIMISEGDAQEGSPITNHVVRKNKFVNYDYGILAGSNDATARQYSHLIAFNAIDNCTHEGIMVKCGDTTVRGNTVRNCANNSISVVAGEGSVVEDNRIMDCKRGIRIAGRGHTVSNNCIVRCGREAIRIVAPHEKTGFSSENIFVERNTCIAWSQDRPEGQYPAIAIDPHANAVIQRNLFFGPGKPFEFVGGDNGQAAKRHCILDNLSSAHHCDPGKGISCANVVFDGIANDNYENTTGYGAQGWMIKPEPFDPDEDGYIPEKCYGEKKQ